VLARAAPVVSHPVQLRHVGRVRPVRKAKGSSLVKELTAYVDRINRANDFDLAWRWTGHGEEPTIEVYEEADRHTLCGGTRDNIIENLRESLPDWDLCDPDA